MKTTDKLNQVVPAKMDNEMDSELKLMQELMKVHSSGIKENIRHDFTLAKLDEKTKEFVTEMVHNAYYTKKMIYRWTEKAKKTPEWKWNEEKQNWEAVKVKEWKLIRMKILADRTFDAFMTRIYMIVTLNRNVEKNHLLRILTRTTEEDRGEATLDPIEHKGLLDKMKKALKREDKPESE